MEEKIENVAAEPQVAIDVAVQVNSAEEQAVVSEVFDVIYEISETPESAMDTDSLETPESAESPAENESPDADESGCDSVEDENSPRKQLERMADEMGAETLLEIIRDNRNAAIRQIIREVEASQEAVLVSGVSCSGSCSSIFDLAALA